MTPGERPRTARLRLPQYYQLEAFNAFGTTVFFLGVFFHARVNHGFSDAANLLLAATQGGAYVLASRAGGRFSDRVGHDRSIACGLAGMCLALAAGWLMQPSWALFAAIGLYSASTALTWPALESAIARAPGPLPLARRTGLYNVTWSFVGAAGFFGSGWLFSADPESVFWAPLAAHAVQLAGLAMRGDLGRRNVVVQYTGSNQACSGDISAPALKERDEGVTRRGGLHRADRREHDGGPQRQDPGENVPPVISRERRVAPADPARFLRAAWIANGLGYFLFGAFSALAPTLGERFGLDPRLAIWLVSSYLFARSGAFLLLWRFEGWEYRRRWVAGALALPPAAYAAIFFTRSPAAAIACLALLGALSGLAYSVSLHASLDREDGHGEGGGLHEWVIGLGVLLGPLAGAAGVGLFGGPAGAGGIVAALGAAAALAGLAPLLRRGGR